MTPAVAGSNLHNTADDVVWWPELVFLVDPERLRTRKTTWNIDIVNSFDGLLLFMSAQSSACQSTATEYLASGSKLPVNVRFSGGGATGETFLLVTRKELEVRGNKYSDLGQQRGEEHKGH